MHDLTKSVLLRLFYTLLVCPAVWLCLGCSQGQNQTSCDPADSIALQSGELQAAFRGNAKCQLATDNLSGISLLVNNDIPDVNAFQSAGMNYEHNISGHLDSRNFLEPRFGQFTADQNSPDSVTLTRKSKDSLWGIGAELTYTVVPPYYIDFEFTATPRSVEAFMPENYVVFFFASYMSGVDSTEGYYFRGIPGPGELEQWVNSSSTPDFSSANFIAESADSLPHVNESELNLHLNNKEWPRISKPFYCGQVAGGMVYEVMFDKLNDPVSGEEVRFSNFKLDPPHPAWDFQFIVHNPQKDASYTLHGRLVWKPFVDLADCESEYQLWIQ